MQGRLLGQRLPSSRAWFVACARVTRIAAWVALGARDSADLVGRVEIRVLESERESDSRMAQRAGPLAGVTSRWRIVARGAIGRRIDVRGGP
jgi:hypothetical protein